MPPFHSESIKAEQLMESVPVTYLIFDEGLAITIDSKCFLECVVEGFLDGWKGVYRDEIVAETQERADTDGRHEQAFKIFKPVRPQPVIVQLEAASVPFVSRNALGERELHEVG